MDPQVKVWIGLVAALMICGFLAVAELVDSERGSGLHRAPMYGDLVAARGWDGLAIEVPRGGSGAPPEDDGPAVSQPPPARVPDWSELPPLLDRHGLRLVDGEFVATPAARRVFDAFFAHFAFTHPELVRGRIGLYILETLPPGSGNAALAVLDQYTNLVSQERARDSLEPVARGELREQVLGRELARALFGDALESAPQSRAPLAPTASAALDSAADAAADSAAWSARMDAYRVRRDEILAGGVGDAVDREEALELEREAHFAPEELGRVRDFDRIESLGR